MIEMTAQEKKVALSTHIFKVCEEYAMAINKIFEIVQPHGNCAFAILSYSFAETFIRLYWYGYNHPERDIHSRRPNKRSSELWFECVLQKTDAYKNSKLLQSMSKKNFYDFRNSVTHGWGYDEYCCMPSTNHIKYAFTKEDFFNVSHDEYEKLYVIHMSEFRDMIAQGAILTLNEINLIDDKVIEIEMLERIWKDFGDDISEIAVKK